MKIIFAVNGSYKHSGIPKYYFMLGKHLIKKGIEVSYILDSVKGINNMSEIVKAESSVTLPEVRDVRSAAEFSFNISRYLLNEEFDILHTCHVNPFFYLHHKHKPVVFQPFGNELFTLSGEGLNKIYCQMAQPILKYCGRHTDVLVSEGEFQHEDMKRWYHNDKIKVLPVGVDIVEPEPRTYYGNQILAVNSLYDYEDMGLLIEAFKLVHNLNQDIKLVIVGSGPLEHELKEQAKFLPVTFYKNISEEHLNKIYAMSDLFVCTTKETDFQMGVLEAMANKIPTICINTDWIQTGVVKCERNAGLLSSTILNTMLMSDYARTKLIDGAYSKVKEFSFDNIADRAIEIYEEIL